MTRRVMTAARGSGSFRRYTASGQQPEPGASAAMAAVLWARPRRRRSRTPLRLGCCARSVREPRAARDGADQPRARGRRTSRSTGRRSLKQWRRSRGGRDPVHLGDADAHRLRVAARRRDARGGVRAGATDGAHVADGVGARAEELCGRGGRAPRGSGGCLPRSGRRPGVGVAARGEAGPAPAEERAPGSGSPTPGRALPARLRVAARFGSHASATGSSITAPGSHGSATASRLAAIEAAGWRVVQVTWTDVDLTVRRAKLSMRLQLARAARAVAA